MWPCGPVDLWTCGPVDLWSGGPVDWWTCGLVDMWTGGPMNLSICGPHKFLMNNSGISGMFSGTTDLPVSSILPQVLQRRSEGKRSYTEDKKEEPTKKKGNRIKEEDTSHLLCILIMYH